MPVDRFFHPRAGHSRKVTLLTDFEFRVWWTYELAADDYGVMRRSAVVLQAANEALAKRTARQVEKALDRLIEIGLVVPFEHQGDGFVCQLDWQDFQKVRHPRESHQPSPPGEILQRCSGSTHELFQQRFGKIPETDPSLAGAGTRETAHGSWLAAEGERRIAERRNTGGALAGGLPRDHLRHVHCGRKCVPEFLHAEFVQALGGDREAANRRLRGRGDVSDGWYAEVEAKLPDGPIGDEPVRFWRAHFAAAFPSGAPRPQSAGQADAVKSNVPSADRTAEFLRKQREAS